MNGPIALGDLAEIIRGVTFERADASTDPRLGKIPILRAGNIGEELSLDDDLLYVPRSLVADRQLLRESDIIICTSSGSPDVVGKTAILRSAWTGAVGAFCSVIRPRLDKIEPRYLAYFLRSPGFRQWTQRAEGINIKNIRASELRLYKIPCPCMPRQQRIADTLDKAAAIGRNWQQTSAEIDNLSRAIFLAMFGDPRTNPKNILKKSLATLIKVKSGEFLPARDMDSSGPYPVYGGNGVSGHHSAFLFEERKIVIGRVGFYCGAIHVSPPKSWITDNALYVSDISEAILFDYLVAALRFANLNKYASQAAQPLISGGRIYPVKILVPSKDQQIEFIARMDRVFTLNNALAIANNESKSLFVSLSQRAFRGEL